MEKLLEQGYKKQKLRAHSDYMWNSAVNDWALSFRDYADIMVNQGKEFSEYKTLNLQQINLQKGEHYD